MPFISSPISGDICIRDTVKSAYAAIFNDLQVGGSLYAKDYAEVLSGLITGFITSIETDVDISNENVLSYRAMLEASINS